MTVLDGFRVAQMGSGLAAAVCGRMLSDLGAQVVRHDPGQSSPLAQYLNHGSSAGTLQAANLIICEGSPAALQAVGHDVVTLRRINPAAAIVLISPFGQTGTRTEEPATDLTLFFASFIARMLTGQVDDLSEPPMPPVGHQSAFIGGLAAACAGMHAALLDNGAVVDVSIQEALATLAMTELARAGQTGRSWSRKRVGDGNGATVCILPASDGYAAISPREDKQWAAWLQAMGAPDWGQQARFATKPDRVANWDQLHALMADWSRDKPKAWIAETAQAAHVPSFPAMRTRGTSGLCPASTPRLLPDSLDRWSRCAHARAAVRAADDAGPAPITTTTTALPSGKLPLSGIRVLDFSWVIAGPTATRYLAAMGAEVIKVEAPGRGDPGRTSELHAVLGQAKKGVVLDLKKPEAIAVAKALAARCDILVENFATGVMDRLGLGPDALRTVAPNLIYVSASGSGRSGPDSHAVAYGTLLQCYAGFAGLNRHPGVPPRVGMAWLDPMCGLMLAFITAASIWRRRTGPVARVDFSMIEAMLWTMAEPLLAEQGISANPAEPAVVSRSEGLDEWVAVAPQAEATAVLARSADLVHCKHLQGRGFWDAHATGVLPGLPWRASFGRATGPAPDLGADSETGVERAIRNEQARNRPAEGARCFRINNEYSIPPRPPHHPVNPAGGRQSQLNRNDIKKH